jgi:4a-hydroxytetrahydrobiopterin dehydratase
VTATLVAKSCTPCRGGVPALVPDEVEKYHHQVPEWVVQDDAHRIERTYRFKNFAEAFAFVRKAAELAEAEGHHPDIAFGWGYATVSLQTKKIKGLHENDFIMAAKLDDMADNISLGP